MKKKRLGRYLFISIFVHMGLLIGGDAFLRSLARKAPDEVIPVETIVLREEPLSPQTEPEIRQQVVARRTLETKSQPLPSTEIRPKTRDLAGPDPRKGSIEPSLSVDKEKLLHPNLPEPTASQEFLTRRTLETKSQPLPSPETRSSFPDLAGPVPKETDVEPTPSIGELPTLDVSPMGRQRDRDAVEAKSRLSVGTETRLRIADLAGPIPKQGDFKPSLSVDHVPTLGALPLSREGEEVASKSKVSTSRAPPLRLAPVHPARPDRTLIFEVEMPKTPIEASTGGTGPYSQTVEKTKAPMGRNRRSTRSISKLRPIPSVQSPSLPEQREMTLAAPPDLPPGRIAKLQTGRSLQRLAPRQRNRRSTRSISELRPIPTVESPSLPEGRELTLAAPPTLPPRRMAKLETSRSPQNLAPRQRNRLSPEAISELPVIPPVKSPSLPEEREMILAPPDGPAQVRIERYETAKRPQPRKRTDRRFALLEVSPGYSTLRVPDVKPTALDLYRPSRFPVPGTAAGAAFLFLVDTSGSVKGGPLDSTRKSAWEFVNLMGQKDRAGIMTFNDNTELVSPFTSKKRLLKEEINKLRTAGTRTVLFDALVRAIGVIQKEELQSKFVILFSDGKDEGSRSTLEEVIEITRRSGVSILSVGYTRVEKRYLDTLREIASETGGVFADAPRFDEIVTLYRASRGVRTEGSKGETIRDGLLSIESKPIGAQVFVDGGFKGKTPLRLELPSGKHEVRLTLTDHYAWAAQVELREGGDTPLLVRLLPIQEKKK